jgi:hypothetical protein
VPGDRGVDDYVTEDHGPGDHAARQDWSAQPDDLIGDDAPASHRGPAGHDVVAGFGGLPMAPEHAQSPWPDSSSQAPRDVREAPGWSQESHHTEPANEQRQRSSTLSRLLQQLELVRDDPRAFDDHLREILRIDARLVDPDDRRNSWDVIRINGWYERISEENSFYKEDVAYIFRIVVIPELGQPDVAEKIARWALNAPNRMIEGLLLAAKKTDAETWHYVMRILEPVLALLHAHQGEFSDQWDPAWATRPAEYQSRGDGKGGGLWGRLRRG